MMAGTERWESHECNKPGQLRKDCSVYKVRTAEKGNKPKRERVKINVCSARSDGRNMEVDDEDFVFVFGNEVSADVQRRETHISISMSFWLRVRVDNKRHRTSTVFDCWTFN